MAKDGDVKIWNGTEWVFIPKGPPAGSDDILGRIGAAIHELTIDLYCVGTPEMDRIADAFEKFANLLERES